MRALLLTLGFAFVVPAQALRLDECTARLTKGQVPVEVREAFLHLQKAGVTSLLKDVYESNVKISVRAKWLPWQPTVSARVTRLTGTKQLVIRGDIDVSTPELREKFIWEVAQALFELRMQPWLWSPNAIKPANADAIDLTKNPIEYFALQMPKEWRDQYLEQSGVMLRELYIVFLMFRELKAEDIMPAKDPGRSWVLNAMFMRNGAESIGPNVEDFELLKRKGLLQMQNAVTERNSMSVLFNYYMAHVKRAMIATAVVSNLWLAPHLLELPGFLESYGETVRYEETLQQAPSRAEETERLTMQHKREREIQRLSERLKLEQGKQSPDDAAIAGLKAQLQTLVERTPGVAYGQ